MNTLELRYLLVPLYACAIHNPDGGEWGHELWTDDDDEGLAIYQVVEREEPVDTIQALRQAILNRRFLRGNP